MRRRDERWWAVESGSPGRRALYYAGPGEWVAHARDAMRFRTPEAARLTAEQVGGDARAVQMEGGS